MSPVSVTIILDKQTHEELQKIADKNCRSIRSEAKFAILEYIKSCHNEAIAGGEKA